MSPEEQTPIEPNNQPESTNPVPQVQPSTDIYAQQPTAEMSQAQMGTPQNNPMADAYVQQTQPLGQPVQPKKSKTGLIIGIVVVVLLFLIGGAVATFLLVNSAVKSSQESSSATSDPKKSSEAAKVNAVTAKYLSDFEIVCDGGSVTNAPTAVKPYKIASFSSQTPKNDKWSSMSVGYGEPYYADRETLSSIGVVACLEMADGSAVKSKTCDFESGGQAVSVDYYAVSYNLTYYEAKTGKALAKGESINGPATTCPYFTTYDKSDPKIYADPDDNAVELVHAKFAQ